MATEQIILRVSEEAACAFREATPEEQLRLEILVSLHLLAKLKPQRALDVVIADMSEQAQERGLTPGCLRTYCKISIRMPSHSPELRAHWNSRWHGMRCEILRKKIGIWCRRPGNRDACLSTKGFERFAASDFIQREA